jgi:hypothetical protein
MTIGALAGLQQVETTRPTITVSSYGIPSQQQQNDIVNTPNRIEN